MEHTYHNNTTRMLVVTLLFMGLCLAGLVLGACTDPVNPDQDPDGGGTGQVDDDNVTAVEGTLEFILEEPAGRAVLGAGLSSELANTWEVLVIGSAGNLTSLKLVPGEAAAISLAPDVYRVLALAGFRRSTTSLTTQLLGSACAADLVTVTAGQSQAVNLVLRAINFTFEPAASAEAGTAQNLSISGDSRNACIGMSLDASASTRPRLRSSALWGGYHDFDTLGGSANNWQASVVWTVPTALGTSDIGFCGAPVVLVNCGTADGPLTDRSAYTWKWPNTYDLQDGDALKTLVQKTVEVVAPQTGVSLILGWE